MRCEHRLDKIISRGVQHRSRARGILDWNFVLQKKEIYRALEARLIELAGEAAARMDLGLETELLSRHRPTPMSSSCQPIY